MDWLTVEIVLFSGEKLLMLLYNAGIKSEGNDTLCGQAVL